MKTLALRLLRSEHGNSLAEQAMILGMVGTGTTVVFGRVSAMMVESIHSMLNTAQLIGGLH